MNTQTQVSQQDMKSDTRKQGTPFDEKRLPIYIAALSLEQAVTWTESDVLGWICSGLIKHRELFCQHLVEGVADPEEAAELAQILAVCEAASSDYGSDTDLDGLPPGEFSPLQKLAAEKRILAAQSRRDADAVAEETQQSERSSRYTVQQAADIAFALKHATKLAMTLNIPERQRLLGGLILLGDGQEEVDDLRKLYFDQEMVRQPLPLDPESPLRSVRESSACVFAEQVQRIIEQPFEEGYTQFLGLHDMIEYHPHMQEEVRALRAIIRGWDLLSNSRLLKHARTA